MPNLHPNSTNYVHTHEPNTNDLVQAMDYSSSGKPIIRTADAQQGYTSKNRSKVSTYQTVFFNTFQYGTETDVWDQAITGTANAVHNPNTNNVDMSVGSTVGDKIIRQTFNVMRYIPGRTSTLTYAVRFQTPVTGIRRRIGLFDEGNGFYFEDAGVVDENGLPEYNVVIRSSTSGSVVETRVPRSQWNGDKLDGTGASTITADASAQQMVNFEYEWYGAGQVVIGWTINGFTHTIHTFNHANIENLPWCSTPFLPIRLELECVSTPLGGGTHYLHQGSNSLISEGEPDKLGIAANITSPITGTRMAVANSWYPILSIRLKDVALKGIILPTFFQVATVDNTNIFYRLCKNAVIGADAGNSAWLDHPNPNAFTQYQVYDTPVAIPDANQGTVLDSGFVIAGGGGTGVRIDKDTIFQIGRSGMGPVSDTFTLLAASDNTGKDAIAEMTWIEQR